MSTTTCKGLILFNNWFEGNVKLFVYQTHYIVTVTEYDYAAKIIIITKKLITSNSFES